ncbi:MAG: copper chaperone PCu(A)C [Gammaproteobacteria bacterium]|nr:copper chaperone PCu(A)C [Gammaproteobacteria bacterium]
MTVKSPRLAAVALFILAGCAQQELAVHDAWIRAAPDGSAMGAAYLTLKNNGSDTEVVGVRSTAHSLASLHTSEIVEGVFRMRELDSIPVKANSVVRFEPGALHIMLMRPIAPLRAGDTVELTLTFSDGREISFDTLVRTERQ